jgi:hypothetical protein
MISWLDYRRSKYRETAVLTLVEDPSLVGTLPLAPKLYRRSGRRITVVGHVDAEYGVLDLDTI